VSTAREVPGPRVFREPELLLPRPLLLRAAERGLDAAVIAEDYGVTESMAAFRLRTTGVLRQVESGKSYPWPHLRRKSDSSSSLLATSSSFA